MGYRRTGRPPGRPRHRGTFTPAEERVVEGIREGLSNAEIAAKLGVSPETVKTHVTNMLVRLDVTDRHELAAWDAEQRRPWWQRALLLHGGALGDRSWPWVALLGGGVVVLAVAVFVLGRRTTDVAPAGTSTAGETAVVILATPTPAPPCGDSWALDSRRAGDPRATLTEGLSRLAWRSYLPEPSTGKYTFESVEIDGTSCRPNSGVIRLAYRHTDGRELVVYQALAPDQSAKGARVISGFIVVNRDYSWHYIVRQQDPSRADSPRSITISDESAAGLHTSITLAQGTSEDATIEELRAVARTIPAYDPQIEPTHPPYEEPVEPDSYTPSPPDGCPTGAPNPAFIANVRQNSIALAEGVLLHRQPFELGWEPGRGILVDVATGDSISYDERGRRTGSSLCDPGGTARLRAVTDAPGFRERVREFLARPAP